jgi:hypothetical protein
MLKGHVQADSATEWFDRFVKTASGVEPCPPEAQSQHEAWLKAMISQS